MHGKKNLIDNFIEWLLRTKVRSNQAEAEWAYAYVVNLIEVKRSEGVKMKTRKDLFEFPMLGISLDEVDYLWEVYKIYLRLLTADNIQRYIEVEAKLLYDKTNER